MARRFLWVNGLAAAGVLAVLFGLLLCQESDPSDLLQGTPGYLRSSRSRLTGGVQREPAADAPARPRPPAPRDLQRISRAADVLAVRIANGSSGERRVADLHNLGALRLAEGRAGDAVLSFEQAGIEAPSAAALQSDLAAAYLTRAERDGRPFDLIQALRAAERALALAPRLAPASFNRAEALTRLQLSQRAIAAWKSYLQVDPRSGWAAEARRRIRSLARPTLEQLWQARRRRLDAALARHEEETVREIAARFPDRVRRHAEDGLLAWAEETQADGGTALAAAGEVGRAIEATTGDRMIADCVAAIDGALHAGGLRSAELRQGHAALGRGLRAYEVQDFDDARPSLLAARDALASGGSPCAAWADLYLGIIDHYSVPAQAYRDLFALRGRLAADRYPALAGRIDWMLGTIEATQNRHEKALAWYRSALELLRRAGNPAYIHILAASAYRDLGQPERAWEERLAGLAALRRDGDLRRLNAALYDTAEDLLDQQHPGPALDFAEELLDNARSWGNVNGLAEARRQRGRALADLGRGGEAMRELRASRRLAAEIPSRDIRARVFSALDLTEGSLLADTDPEQAVRLLGRALATRQSKGYRYRVPALLVARARAWLRRGDFGRAETDLRRAIEELESLREEVRAEDLRVSSFEQAQAAFDEMVSLQVERYGDVAAALGFAERARSRLLLDLIDQRGAGETGSDASRRLPRALPAAEILARLPAEIRLVEYLVLPDRLLIWVVRRGTVRLVTARIGQSELDDLVRALRLAMRRRAGERELRRQGARLHEVLIRPLAPELAAGAPLVVVPDRSLMQVPFAALFDPRRHRYLVEDHTLTVAPSATLYLAALERDGSSAPSAPRDALVVGDPAFDRRRFPRLDRLPFAKTEAAAVASLYDQADLLRDAAATRAAFLARAPARRVVHFAGHSLLHPDAPWLSQLLFAPGGGDSGALYARELAGLRLERTELVVLSACRTLEGAAASRESVVGLAAAFLAAGPPVVVASLWKVDDEATRELMVAFHQALRRGEDPASALRTAQRRLLGARGGSFRSAADWAGFEAFGGAPLREN